MAFAAWKTCLPRKFMYYSFRDLRLVSALDCIGGAARVRSCHEVIQISFMGFLQWCSLDC